MPDERRHHKRAYIHIPVECRGKNYWQCIETIDVSAGGMFIASEKVEPPNTKIEIMFEIGENEKKFVRADAIVAWSRAKPVKDDKGDIQPAGMGIQFTKVNPLSAKDFIDQLISKREENKSGE
ncbi:MAG: PilZ domain-containing protein [Candidatus Omnitrophota bacterium]|nr:PilZ domain-containing protein [Candidatus Omnitrophota bacterium]